MLDTNYPPSCSSTAPIEEVSHMSFTKPYQGTKRGANAAHKLWCKTRLIASIDDYISGKYTWREIAKNHCWSSTGDVVKAVKLNMTKHIGESSEEMRQIVERSYRLVQEKCLIDIMRGSINDKKIALDALIRINQDISKLYGFNAVEKKVFDLSWLEAAADKKDESNG